MPKTLDKAKNRDRIRRKKKDGMVVTGKSVFNIIQILVNRRRKVNINKLNSRDRKISKKNKISSDREEDKKKKSRKNFVKRREEKENLSYSIIKQDAW